MIIYGILIMDDTCNFKWELSGSIRSILDWSFELVCVDIVETQLQNMYIYSCVHDSLFAKFDLASSLDSSMLLETF